jgi:predicted amidohydrolase
MKIALAEASSLTGDIKANLQTLHKFVIRAKENDTDALFFGEAFLQGFDSLTFDFRQDTAITKTLDCPELYFISRLAHDKQLAIGLGFYRRDHDAIHSSYIVFGHNGETLALYDRISSGWKIKEADSHYQNGKELVSFSLQGKTFGIGLCGDGFSASFLKKAERAHFTYFVWPVYLNFNEKEWQKELPSYQENAARLGEETYLIGSLSPEPKSLGGAFVFKNQKVLCSIPLGEEGLLLKTIQ